MASQAIPVRGDPFNGTATEMPGPMESAYAGVEGQQPLGPEYTTPLVRSPMAGHIAFSRIGEGNLGPGLFAERDERFQPYTDSRANVPYSLSEPGFEGPDVGGAEFSMPASYGLGSERLSESIKPFDRGALTSISAFDPKSLKTWLGSLKK